MKTTLLAALAALAITGAQAAPLHQGIYDKQYSAMPVLDELSMAIISGAPDHELVSVLNEIRLRDGRHDIAAVLMALGPKAFNGDPWSVIQQRKEALMSATSVIVPVARLRPVINAVQTARGGVMYSLYKQDAGDYRHPTTVDRAGNLVTCGNHFSAGEDRGRYCASLGRMTPAINNPQALWLPNKDLGAAFGCSQKPDGTQECKTAAGESAWYSQEPMLAVVADITQRKPQFLGDKAIIGVTAKHGVIIDVATGALLYKSPIELQQVAGEPLAWNWGEDAMTRVAAESRAIAKEGRAAAVQDLKERAVEKFDAVKSRVATEAQKEGRPEAIQAAKEKTIEAVEKKSGFLGFVLGLLK